MAVTVLAHTKLGRYRRAVTLPNVKTTAKGRDQRVRQRTLIPTLRVLYSPNTTVLPAVRIAGPVVIGRSPEATVQLPDDDRLSRKHAELTLDSTGSIQVTDTSVNGVFINGERMIDPTVHDGDILRLGDSLMIVRYREPGAPEAPLPRFVGDSPAIQKLYKLIRQVAPTDATVLILGETGTGKDLVARALHDLGAARESFVAVNCAAIAESLAEAALFGHVAGAFTGAGKESPGYFRAADGGVLFLDEVGDLSAAMQARLLRALEEHSVTPVGSVQPIATHSRVVAATNRNLASSVAAGAFRGDLYARLAEILVVTPPLRERREDILPIFHSALGVSTPLSPDLAEALLLHPWPFNVRELVKLATDLRVRGAGLEVLDIDLVEDRIRASAPEMPPSPVPLRPTPVPEITTTAPDRRAPPAKDELARMLEEHRGSVADIARITGRSRKQVYRWLELHGLDADSYRR
jgi:DNA-binding NtrC family response regulator